MKVLKKVSLLSVANVLGMMGVVWGLVIAILAIALGGLITSVLPGAGAAVGVGIISIIVFPLTYGIVGFVAGVICALLYNIVAKRIGGIKIDLK